VETKETPLSKVVVPMLKVTPIIGMKESEAAFEMRIVNAVNLLVGNYNAAEYNAYTELRHGQLNCVFELAGVLCQPRPEPIRHAPKKWKAPTMVQALAPKRSTEKQKCVKVSSCSGDPTSA
jgi:hypothetical protein